MITGSPGGNRLSTLQNRTFDTAPGSPLRRGASSITVGPISRQGTPQKVTTAVFPLTAQEQTETSLSMRQRALNLLYGLPCNVEAGARPQHRMGSLCNGESCNKRTMRLANILYIRLARAEVFHIAQVFQSARAAGADHLGPQSRRVAGLYKGFSVNVCDIVAFVTDYAFACAAVDAGQNAQRAAEPHGRRFERRRALPGQP